MRTTEGSGARARFIGEYGSGTVDTASNLVLLDDGTFCFSFMGGTLDHIAAGHWHLQPDGSSIQLREARPDRPPFVVRLPELVAPDEQVRVVFGGYTMSEAERPVFAVSSTETPPHKFRLLFPTSLSSWHESYGLHVDAYDARHLFLGIVEEEEPGLESMLQIFQFSLPPAQTALIDFDVRASIPRIDVVARLGDGGLYLGEELFSRRGDVSPDLAEEVRNGCIGPLLESGSYPLRGDRSEFLLPTRSFRVPTDRILDEPWFAPGARDRAT